MGLFSLTQTASFAGKIFDSKISTEPVIETKSFKPPFSHAYHSERLERCAPEDEGIPSRWIEDFLRTLANDRTINIHSIMIARHGRLLCEAAFGAQQTDIWKYTFSACKSVISLAIGILLDDGVLSLEERVVDIFSKEASPLAKIKLKDLTVEHLLTMRSPVLFAEIDSAVEADWLRGYFSSLTKGEPGQTFRYNSLNTYILSAIIVRKSGMSVSDFLNIRLFSHLGIAADAWYFEKCPQDIEKGGWGMFLYPEDFCKIAQLVMQKGRWKTEKLISEDYLSAATRSQVNVTEPGTLFDYGYHIWVGKQTDTFLFNGMLGQNIIGFYRNDLIIVCNAGNGELFQQSRFFKHLIDYFDRDFDSVLPASPKSRRSLSRYIGSLSAYSAPVTRSAEKKARASNLWFDAHVGCDFYYFSGYEKSVGLLPLILQAVENCYPRGLKGISLRKEGIQRFLVYQEKDIAFRIPVNFHRPQKFQLSLGGNNFYVAVTSRFTTDEDERCVLVFQIDFLEFPSSRILKLVFLDEDTVLLRQDELPGKDFAVETVRARIGDYTDKPILSGIIERIGVDFFEYKAEHAFAPEVVLKAPEK